MLSNILSFLVAVFFIIACISLAIQLIRFGFGKDDNICNITIIKGKSSDGFMDSEKNSQTIRPVKTMTTPPGTSGFDFSELKPKNEVYFEIGINTKVETIAQKVSLKM